MKILNVSCNNCGAALDVPKKTRFVTCSFCDSRLEVQRTDNAYYTNVLEAVGDIREDVRELKLQNELERLDREWSMTRKRWTTRDQHGNEQLPGSVDAVIPMVIGVIVCVLAILQWQARGVAVGLLALLLAWGFSRAYARRRQLYESSKQRYYSQRRELARELRQA